MSAPAFDARARALAHHYSRFLGAHRGEVLLTGHSHQAWPDASREGQLEAWDDAARLVDGKWERVFGEILPELAGHIARRIGSGRPGDLAFAPNTHELVARFMSCFPRSSVVVTTDSEFHSLRRQLERAEEDGAVVRRVAAEEPRFAERFLRAVDEAAPNYVALSLVLFTTSRVLEELPEILAALADRGVPALVDVYHAFNVLQLAVDRWPGEVFVTGGGYKYAEWGEGVCWMLLPPSAARYRPANTGWFAHFASLSQGSGGVQYGAGGARFLGATFDPSGHYRALHVLRFMDREGLDVATLRAHSLAQTAHLMAGFDARGLARRGFTLMTPRDQARGGFVSLGHARATQLAQELRAQGIHTDVRGDLLRLGPAPYTTREELDRALDVLARLAAAESSG